MIDLYKIQIIQTVVLILILVIILKIIKSLIDKAGLKFSYQKGRIKVVKKIITIVSYLIFVGVVLLIWGIEPSQLAGFLASLFTVLGIGFLAQWSILSNMTSTLIIFFNHQVNIGDYIVILDKDNDVKGKISDIGIFFIVIKVEENEYVSMPSNVFMQKMIKKTKA